MTITDIVKTEIFTECEKAKKEYSEAKEKLTRLVGEELEEIFSFLEKLEIPIYMEEGAYLFKNNTGRPKVSVAKDGFIEIYPS